MHESTKDGPANCSKPQQALVDGEGSREQEADHEGEPRNYDEEAGVDNGQLPAPLRAVFQPGGVFCDTPYQYQTQPQPQEQTTTKCVLLLAGFGW